MRKLICAAFLVVLPCLLASSAKAQGAYYYSQVSYDDDTSLVTGYSATEIDYSTSWYYNAAVDAYLYDQYGNFLDCGSDQEPNFAAVDTVAYGDPGTDYRLDTYNYEVDIYYYIDIQKSPEGCYPCDGCNSDCYYYYENWFWYDPFGFSFSPTGYYDSWWYSYGYGPPEYVEDTEYNEVAESHKWAAAYKLDITPDLTVNDGSNAAFHVSVERGNVTINSFAWSFTAPSGAGNNPNVNFSSPTEYATNTDAHWFANPNQPCSPSADPAAPYFNAKYTIKCDVTLSNGDHKSKQTHLIVNAYWYPAGYVNIGEADVTGVPDQTMDSNGVWHLSGMGTLQRVIPTKHVNIPTTSQFFAKSDAHEQAHVDHWSAGQLYGDLFQPADLYDRVKNFTSSSQGDLIAQFVAERTAYINQQRALANQRHNTDEQQAYGVSDQVAPLYVYQLCGSYQL